LITFDSIKNTTAEASGRLTGARKKMIVKGTAWVI